MVLLVGVGWKSIVNWLEFMACVDGLGNCRQKDSGALIFSSAGTLNRWNSIQMA